MPRISILTIGAQESDVIPALVNLNSIELDIICSNLLDFELPPKVENAAAIWHRHELRNILKQIGEDKFNISTSLKNLLKENDRMDLDEKYLSVTSHISQIEQNSKNLKVAYDLLLDQTDREKLKLYPLSKTDKQILVFKQKKFAPLRYFYEMNKLLETQPPPSENKRKYNDKELVIEGLTQLSHLKLTDEALKSMQESDLIIISPTDIVSLSILFKAEEIEKQIRNVTTPLVLIWPFDDDYEITENEKQILENLDFKYEITSFADDLSFITDYVIIRKSQKSYIEVLREYGCHVLLSEFKDDDGNISENFINTLLSVSSSVSEIDNGDLSENKETEEIVEDISDEEEKVIKGKEISQLVESPEEAGIEKMRENLDITENSLDSNLDNIIEEITERENDIDEEPRKIEMIEENSSQNNKKTEDVDNGLIEEEEEDIEELEEEEITFNEMEDEDWIDTVNRASELAFQENDDEALKWLIDQSSTDADKEVQIADHAISKWIDSRSMTDRKRGAEIVSKLSQNHPDTYIQILQKHMIQAVTEKQEDKRRLLIPLFLILYDVDINISVQLIRGITKDLAVLNDEEEKSVIELAKLTILQLVIQSRRLSRVTIRQLLNILDTKPNVGPEIWNILIAFDAGSVSLELVTNFSISKSEEILRRSNLLRFTGSFYSTITKVIQAWKEGDKAAISNVTGSIIPEETLRKFERLELARKLDKLKMVQLTTLAESLGKDVETVERLITELIVNDELHAEMKLIDEKMYLVATETDDDQ